MKIVEYVLFGLLVVLGTICSVSDIRTGIVHNKVLILFVGIGFIVDIVYYVVMARDLILLFLLNFGTASILSMILYFTHSLAGGDCKLITVLSLLYPAGMYMSYGNNNDTLFVSICFGVLYGYIYLLADGIWRLISGDRKISKEYVFRYLGSSLKSYFRALVYEALISLLFMIAGDYLGFKNTWIEWIICGVVTIISSRSKTMKNTTLVLITIFAVIVLSLVFSVIPFSLNPVAYSFTAVLILCQMLIRTNLYETIPTSQVKKGMILSLPSSVIMQNSGIEGMPKLSLEDLSSRLTDSEAERIKLWGENENTPNSIVILRKIPFAVFIFLGYLSYYLLWRVVS